MLVSGQKFHHPDVGVVHLTVMSNSHSYSMRWSKDYLRICVPASASAEDVYRIIDQNKDVILKNKPSLRYSLGQTFRFYNLSIQITQQKLKPDKILAQLHDDTGTIAVGTNWDMNESSTSGAISNFICKMAQRKAASSLIPRGKEIATKLNLQPSGWEISTGHRKLGHCTTKGIISLSYVLMFLPPHLLDYIICHELAHLSEMNHSKKFHALCNQYCNGREKELIAELKQFNWPILK